jgi:hypothetical protein
MDDAFDRARMTFGAFHAELLFKQVYREFVAQICVEPEISRRLDAMMEEWQAQALIDSSTCWRASRPSAGWWHSTFTDRTTCFPHSAFRRQMPDEQYFGTGDAVPADLTSLGRPAPRTPGGQPIGVPQDMPVSQRAGMTPAC